MSCQSGTNYIWVILDVNGTANQSDENNDYAHTVFTVSVAIATASLLPHGTITASYSTTLQAEGGTGTYTWSIISGNLPPGLSLNSSTGVISGIATAANIYNFTVQATSGSQTGTKNLKIAINNLPVLLVHGFQPKVPFHPDKIWKGMAEVLTGSADAPKEKPDSPTDLWFVQRSDSDPNGRNVYISNYARLNFLPTTSDIADYARTLAFEIAFIKKEEGVSKINIVAHSMGGLVARRYIEAEDFPPPILDPDIIYGNDINKLIMIATPNHGAIFAVIDLLESTSVEQMSPSSFFLGWLNSGVTNGDKNVEYYTIAGEIEFKCENNLCYLAQSVLHFDGVVTLNSVMLGGAVNYKVWFADHSQLICNERVLTSVRDLLDGNSLLSTTILTPYDYSTEAWYVKIPRKLWIVRCPVDVTITDQYGRRISNTGLNEIPDAYVQIIGDEKYFYLPSDLTYTVETSAFNSGTMSIEASI